MIRFSEVWLWCLGEEEVGRILDKKELERECKVAKWKWVYVCVFIVVAAYTRHLRGEIFDFVLIKVKGRQSG